ncbi:LuxR C-terminal-related transcriptional regulator [Candidatus Leptofilum sp.]|uniref:helix-turn-helix transcriptional regulator n=1 Tax=Candidatus Leptofilum sp. TaxID=3241576 RepID=UPI003B5A4A87
MSPAVLTAKLYLPPPRPKLVVRQRLLDKLNEGLDGRKLTLVSAPAGFGKSTLLSSWLHDAPFAVAWLSLDEDDNDPARFLLYLIAALQTAVPDVGQNLLPILQSPQPPPSQAVLTPLLNELTQHTAPVVLVLDDYHLIEAQPVDEALTFLLQHLPPQLHLVIATREDPPLPLARLRARGQLTELRAADLRFSHDEASDFLNKAMELNLPAAHITALEARTEGWAVGLQLAAISLQGQADSSQFIDSFTGSHRFVLDYLVEEVLHQLPAATQHFLLHTSILERLYGPLCEAILTDATPGSGAQTLRELEQANLFIIPLDDARRWYRYRHLFAELLRQRLQQEAASNEADLHLRASIWYEANNLEIDAFHHATLAGDIERATRLVEGGGMPLHFRGAVTPVLNWLGGLPMAVLDQNPVLWVLYASALLFVGQLADAAQKADAAEAALAHAEPNEAIRDLIGHVASIRATLAISQHQVETIIVESERALAHLHPKNLPVRTATIWSLGVAHLLQGNLAAAAQAFTEAISISEQIGHFIIHIMATLGLAQVQQAENKLTLAGETFQRVLAIIGEAPFPIAGEAHLGLAQISYEQNDLAAAKTHINKAIPLARQIIGTDRYAVCQLMAARLKLAAGDVPGAEAALAAAEQFVQAHSFAYLLPEITVVQTLLKEPTSQPLADPLSPRELEVLQLIAQGLSNREIGERLFLTLNTIKGHNRRIFGKLQVQRRTEAVALARELGLL